MTALAANGARAGIRGSGAILPVLFLVVAAAAPIFANGYVLEVGIVLLMFAYLGSSWNILGGWAGQMSFGHAAFFGLGAYVSALLWINAGVSPWIGMLIGALVAAAFGVVVAIATFRAGLRGHYFALAMFAVAQMLMALFVNLKEVAGITIGGSEGLQLPYTGTDPGQMVFDSRMPFYYILLAMLVVVQAVVKFISISRFGAYLQAVRNDEDAAEALGVNVFGCKVAAMAVSAFFTGAVGAVYGQIYLYIEPGIVFSATYSIQGLLCAVVGGAGTVWGPVLGALVLTPLAEVSKVFFRDISGLDLMIFGAVLIVFVRFIPQGLVGLWTETLARRRGGSRS
ncbi:MAG TPA: branched-chain amino acid ABC transporter permease [Mesorhizobium sp.]